MAACTDCRTANDCRSCLADDILEREREREREKERERDRERERERKRECFLLSVIKRPIMIDNDIEKWELRTAYLSDWELLEHVLK